MQHILGITANQQEQEATKFLLKLKEVCNVSQRPVSEVIEGCNRLFGNSFSIVKASVKDILGKAGICMSTIEGLDAFFSLPRP